MHKQFKFVSYQDYYYMLFGQHGSSHGLGVRSLA